MHLKKMIVELREKGFCWDLWLLHVQQLGQQTSVTSFVIGRTGT